MRYSILQPFYWCPRFILDFVLHIYIILATCSIIYNIQGFLTLIAWQTVNNVSSPLLFKEESVSVLNKWWEYIYLCIYVCMCLFIYVWKSRHPGNWLSDVRALKTTQNVKKRRINAKTGSKLKEITMQKSAPKFWLPSFYKFFQVWCRYM